MNAREAQSQQSKFSSIVSQTFYPSFRKNEIFLSALNSIFGKGSAFVFQSTSILDLMNISPNKRKTSNEDGKTEVKKVGLSRFSPSTEASSLSFITRYIYFKFAILNLNFQR